MVSIKEFLEMYSSKATLKGYTSSLKCFFGFLGVNPDIYFEAYKNAETLKARDETLDKIMLDVTRWLKHLEIVEIIIHKNKKRIGYSPKSIQTMSGCIRAYLLVNRVDLGRAFWKKMKITGEALTEDRIPTKDDLRKTMSHLDLLGRAFLLFRISTGQRISDALKVPLDALDFTTTPTRVKYYIHKIRKWHTGFLTKEATLEVQEWIQNREQFLLDANKNAYRLLPKKKRQTIGFDEFCEKKSNKDMLFPVTTSSIYDRYWSALERSGLGKRDEQTNVRLLHDQTLRKYFKTMAGRAVSEAVADALTGHTRGLNDLKTVYNRHQDMVEALAQDFLKVEKEISLTMEVTSSKEIAEFRETLENQDAKMKYLQQENEGLKTLVSSFQQLLYGINDADRYVPPKLQPMLYGTSFGFKYPDDEPIPQYAQEQFVEFLKSEEFLKSKQYQQFLKQVKKNQSKKQN